MLQIIGNTRVESPTGFRRIGGHPLAATPAVLAEALLASENVAAAELLSARLKPAATRAERAEEIIQALEELDTLASEIPWRVREDVRRLCAKPLHSVLGLGALTPKSRLRRIVVSAFEFADSVANDQAQQMEDRAGASQQARQIERGLALLNQGGEVGGLDVFRRRWMAGREVHDGIRSDIEQGLQALSQVQAKLAALGQRRSTGAKPKVGRYVFVLRLAEAYTISTGVRVPLSDSGSNNPFIRFLLLALVIAGLGPADALDEILRKGIAKDAVPGGPATQLMLREQLEEFAGRSELSAPHFRPFALGDLPSCGIAIDFMGTAALFDPVNPD